MRNLVYLLIPLLLVSCASVRDAQHLNVGDEREKVISELGTPSERKAAANQERLDYVLQSGSRFWQVVLAPLTCGINLLVTEKYAVYLQDGKVTGVEKAAQHTSGANVLGTVFKGGADGYLNGSQNQNRNKTNCTSTTIGPTTSTECQ